MSDNPLYGGVDEYGRSYAPAPGKSTFNALSPPGASNAIPGLLTGGNINLHARPRVQNPDGSISTVRSISVTDDQGRVILIPTVVGNQVVSNQDAVDYFRKSGQHLGIFESLAHADAYAQSLHEDQAREYVPRP